MAQINVTINDLKGELDLVGIIPKNIRRYDFEEVIIETSEVGVPEKILVTKKAMKNLMKKKGFEVEKIPKGAKIYTLYNVPVELFDRKA